MITRKPEQVAKRALILGAIAARGGFEASDHPNRGDKVKRLLLRLQQLECEDEIDPKEKILFTAPLGELSRSEMVDVNWASEDAMFFCWILKITKQPIVTQHADTAQLFTMLPLFSPDASAFICNAELLPSAEIEAFSRTSVLVRSLLHESRIELQYRHIIRKVHVDSLSAVGIEVSQDAMSNAEEIMNQIPLEERGRVAALCFIRSHAGLWMFNNSRTYFETDDSDNPRVCN